MMRIWIDEAVLTIHNLIGTVGSTTEYRVLVGLAVVAFLFALINIAAAMGSTMATPMRVALVSAIGALLVLAAVVAVQLYLLPNLRTHAVNQWIPLIVTAIIVLALVAPLSKWLLSSGYFEAVFALVLSTAAAAMVVVLVHAAFNAFRQGDKGFIETQRRREGINRVIDDT